MMHAAPAIERLGIPAYNWWSEALHGVARAGRATVFPQAIGLAATFDEDLLFRVSSVISDEARAMYNAAINKNYYNQYQGLTFWSPNVNIFRDPRWGRGQETYGEDPFLSGSLGTAFVHGLQADNPNYLKAAACAKHYAVHSGPEGLRHEFNAKASPKDLFETYLPQFKMLVDAGVEAVMCAYNRTNDEACCGSEYMLTEVLRKDWGFKGHIVSDCGAILDIHAHHKVTSTPEESAALAIKSGVNLNCGTVFSSIPAAVENGLLTEKEVDQALKTLLITRFKLGLFDPPERNPYNNISENLIHSVDHIKLSREAAQKSIVLLRNKNNVLPLPKDLEQIFVTGPIAANVDVLLGNYYGLSDNMVTILEGIVGKVENSTAINYTHGVLFDRENLNPLDWSTGNARYSNATIAVVGSTPLIEGEEGEAIASKERGDRSRIDLPLNQLNYIRHLREASGDKPLIVVVTGGSPLAMEEIQELADAVLFVWYPGEQGGNAVADIIFGDAVPSGRLPVTFPKSTKQLPPYNEYSMVGRGYRYMEEDPLYPFGFGLSFTQFEYSGLQLSASQISKKDSIIAEFTISNTGSVAGEEIVQLYLTDIEASFRVPKYSLKGFKTVTLEPGESKNITFKITPEMMASVDLNGINIIEPGKIKITIGGSSPGNRSQELGAPKPLEAQFSVGL
ncbi:MAG: glycoside hydrolase family 3 C-terminal domain-containing protein [Bacteroidales bacterium]|nr:glycoside hydrolase family 3 C-terminal domain-containing protein [Bacteroidales bacterium]